MTAYQKNQKIQYLESEVLYLSLLISYEIINKGFSYNVEAMQSYLQYAINELKILKGYATPLV